MGIFAPNSHSVHAPSRVPRTHILLCDFRRLRDCIRDSGPNRSLTPTRALCLTRLLLLTRIWNSRPLAAATPRGREMRRVTHVTRASARMTRVPQRMRLACHMEEWTDIAVTLLTQCESKRILAIREHFANSNTRLSRKIIKLSRKYIPIRNSESWKVFFKILEKIKI